MKLGFHIASVGTILLLSSCYDKTPQPHLTANGDDTTAYTIKKTLAVSPDKVYETYLDPQSLKQIWGVESLTVDARPDGHTKAKLRINDENWDFTLTYKEVIQNQKLKWVVNFDEHPNVEIWTTVVFNSVKEGTELSFSQENFNSKAQRDKNRAANEESLDKLTSLLIKY